VLLEHLPNHPKSDWPAIASGLTDDPDLLAEATAVLNAPHLAHLFGPNSLAEVPLTATFGGQQMVGTIDRLIITPDHILAVDYKSNAVIPKKPEDTPGGLLRQIAAYADALAQIYPGYRIETAILWTRTAKLMPIDPDIVRAVTPLTPIP
jgi:ATP-dependent helicase/nuclease subunit A